MAIGKKESILAIAKILFEKTDKEHPIQLNKVAEYLLNDYDICMERKAISKTYERLEELGFRIVSGGRGSYLDRENSDYLGCGFSNAELRLLIDAIRCNRYLSIPRSKKLIKKLENLTNDYFAHSFDNTNFLGDWDKSDNIQVFETVQTIEQAIQLNCQVAITYAKYGEDKKLHKTSEIAWSPYLLLWHNQRYYLMANNEKHQKMNYLRVDQMISVKILDVPRTPEKEVPGYKYGIDKKDTTARPYMFADAPSNIVFTIPKNCIWHVIDWFGKDFHVEHIPEGSLPYSFLDQDGRP